MDNHAGNLLKCNNNYMSGLIDSDFGVYIHKFFPRGRLQLRPTIQFVNVNFDIIEVINKLLLNLNINHHISFRKATVGRDKKELTITRLTKCIDFAECFYRGCVVKQHQLNILSKFCSDRLFSVDNMGWKQNNTPYTDKQLKLFDEITYYINNYNTDYGFRNMTKSWLAGLVDGDGSLCFVIGNNGRVIPTLDITTGSDTCFNNIIDVFTLNNIKYDVRINKSKSTKRKRCNTIYNIYVRSFDSLLNICKLLDNKLIIKSQQCKNIIDYIEHSKICRLNTYYKSDIVCSNKILNTK